MRGVEWWVGCLCGLLACGRSEDTSRAPPTAPALQIDARVVGQLAQALAVPPDRAKELATEDALLAAEFVRREPALAASLERVVLARSLARALLEDAEGDGAPSDAELDQLTRERWWELDRPRMVQVVHAVVLSQAENLEAEALAERIAKAVAQATKASEFETAAKLVPPGAYTVKVETLPPMTADGRAIDPEKAPPAGPPVQGMAVEFAAATAALTHVGQLSPVVRTPFGYHVLLATRILEPRQPSLDQRRELLRAQVLQRRALTAQAQVLDQQRGTSSPEQSRTARQSMAKLAVSP